MAAVRRLLSSRLCRCGDPALTRARGGQPRCEDLAVEHLLGRVDGRLLQLLLGSGSERTRRRPDVREVAGAGHLGVARASEPIAEELTRFLIATPATF